MTIRQFKGIILLCLYHTTNATEISSIHFQRIGTLAPDTTTYLFIGKFPTKNFFDHQRQFQSISNLIKEVSEHITQETPLGPRTLITSQLKLVELNLETLASKVKDLETISQEKYQGGKLHRGKRSVAIIAGLAAIGTAIGNLLFNQQLDQKIRQLETDYGRLHRFTTIAAYHIEENHAKIEQLNKTVLQLAQHEFRAEAMLRKETTKVEYVQHAIMLVDLCYRNLAALNNDIHKLLKIWDDAVQGRITTEMFPPKLVKEELRKIKQELDNPLQLAINSDNIMQIYTLTSHAIVGRGLLRIAIPIPVFNPETVFDLLQHVPLPIALTKKIEIETRSEKPTIAVNPERTLYRELEFNEIRECAKVGSLHLCPQLRVTNKASQPSCLFLLLLGKLKEAQRHCKSHIRPTSDLRIIQSTTNHFIAYAIADTRITRICGERRDNVPILKGTSLITVREGCALSSDKLFVAAARKAILAVEEWSVIIPTTPSNINLSDLVHANWPDVKMSHDDLTKAIEGLLSQRPHIMLKDLRRALDRRAVSPIIHHWPFASMGLIGLLFLTTILICGYYCRQRCHQHSNGQQRHVDYDYLPTIRRKRPRQDIEMTEQHVPQSQGAMITTASEG